MVSRLHFVGIKGVGMTALAQILKAAGAEISGSDTAEYFFTQDILKKEGINFFESFNAENLGADVAGVVYSSAYGEDNLEIIEAKRRRLELMSYAEAVGQFTERNHSIAVAGSHGKTTTTALLGYVLAEAGFDPTVLVGSTVPQFGGGARVGKGEWFVFEADEYQNKFQFQFPKIILLNNIDWDHPDFFPDPISYERCFADFVAKLPEADGLLVANQDDAAVRRVVGSAKCRVVWFGKDTHAFARVPLKLIGEHNALNAIGVAALAEALGATHEKIIIGLKNFTGTKRRFEILGERDGVLVIDDYGHHPTEIRVTLEAARQKFADRRLWCIFHPHTFTRTKTYLADFAQSFKSVDQVVVADVYGSAREKQGGIHARDVVAAINEVSHNARYGGSLEQITELLKVEAKSGDVIITMGAGDVWRVGETFLEKGGGPVTAHTPPSARPAF